MFIFIALIDEFWKRSFHKIDQKLIIQKTFQNKKIAGTFLFVSWLAIYQWKKVTENCNSVGAGAHKVGKAFGPTFTLILPIFGQCKKVKLHILKTFGLSKFKEILTKYVYNSTVIFFNVLLRCLKGYSETLNYKKLSFTVNKRNLFMYKIRFVLSFILGFIFNNFFPN